MSLPDLKLGEVYQYRGSLCVWKDAPPQIENVDPDTTRLNGFKWYMGETEFMILGIRQDPGDYLFVNIILIGTEAMGWAVFSQHDPPFMTKVL